MIRLVTDPDVLRAHAADASGLTGSPEALVRATSEADVQECLREARSRGTTVTPIGLQSATTGAATASAGWLLSLAPMDRVLDVDRGGRTAVCEPGAVLADLKRAVDAEGLQYPPDPTSEAECTLGGTLATNATGARTLRYGPTRAWVREVRVVHADGRVADYARRPVEKDNAGYHPFLQPLDLFLGSEGTLGVITRAVLRLAPKPAGVAGLLACFDEVPAAVDAAVALRRHKVLQPRCIELLDGWALRVVRAEGPRFPLPAGAGAALYLEEETPGELMPVRLAAWQDFLAAARARVDEALVVEDAAGLADLRRLRHAVPARFNELAAPYVVAGGRKVAMDWAVPVQHLSGMIRLTRERVEAAGVATWTTYGHVGSGHPHVNLLATDDAETARWSEVARAITREAVLCGGTVAAEHGIGKTKRELLTDLHPAWVIRAMRAVKRELDPNGLLAPGNLFED